MDWSTCITTEYDVCLEDNFQYPMKEISYNIWTSSEESIEQAYHRFCHEGRSNFEIANH